MQGRYRQLSSFVAYFFCEISAIPTESELQTLRLFVPSFFEISFEEQQLRLTFHGFQKQPPLVRFVLRPTKLDGDFSGPLAAEILEDLAGILVTSYKLISRPDAPSHRRVVEIVEGTAEAVSERTGEEELTITVELFAISEEDWFGS